MRSCAPQKNCCMTFWGGWKNSLFFLNNLSVDHTVTVTAVARWPALGWDSQGEMMISISIYHPHHDQNYDNDHDDQHMDTAVARRPASVGCDSQGGPIMMITSITNMIMMISIWIQLQLWLVRELGRDSQAGSIMMIISITNMFIMISIWIQTTVTAVAREHGWDSQGGMMISKSPP